jgi:hypothetical protein
LEFALMKHAIPFAGQATSWGEMYSVAISLPAESCDQAGAVVDGEMSSAAYVEAPMSASSSRAVSAVVE